MAKESVSLVQLAEVISGLSPNEMATLGKIVMAKQQMVQPQQPGQVSNVPGPMGAAPVPPQMNQMQQPRRMAPPSTRDAMMPGLLNR